MKRFLKILKITTATVLTLLLLIVLAGVITLQLGAPQSPPGKLVKANGIQFHVDVSGQKSEAPTLVIEGGSGMATGFYHWLNKGLQDSIRVFRYDRAGIGYSEASPTPRTPEPIARELHALLEAAGEEPPYVLAGHSLGGPYAQVFTELYPDEVAGLALLDATHPDRIEVFNIPPPTSLKFRAMIWMYDLQAFLADVGVLLLYDKLAGPIMNREFEGLPTAINEGTLEFLNDGKYLRTMGQEMAQYHAVLERVGTDNDFGTLPVRIFPATPHIIPDEHQQEYLKKGINLREGQTKKIAMQEDFLNLSSNSKLIPVAGNHNTIYTQRENAEVIIEEILLLYRELRLVGKQGVGS